MLGDAPTVGSAGLAVPARVAGQSEGDVLDFDETAPFLKATKTIPPQAWGEFAKGWKDPWPDLTTIEVMDDLRGPVEIPTGASP